MKKWIPILLIFVVIVVVLFILNQIGMIKTMSADDLKNSIEIVEVKTMWVEKFYQPWPPKLTLVPAISFRVKNISGKPLRYINFNAKFRFRDDYENLGDCFLAAIRGTPIAPGEKSDKILLKSNYGVEGSSKTHFENNPAWRVAECELFATSRGSHFVLMGKYIVSRTIDFEEPAPVGIK
ncbi:MAG: hypothetical protein KKB53_04950 [Acidobacteria bacterium]|nr:hypothetical protein [Acidobacteriota bacterium]MBU4496331.1 hypothetical protein [Acidobacteriota bacterium]MCG2816169.1 hypothetical protein [Candidatus Aminicenantes bacterium]